MNPRQKTRLFVATKDLQKALCITAPEERDVLVKLAVLRYEVDTAYKQLSTQKVQNQYACLAC